MTTFSRHGQENNYEIVQQPKANFWLAQFRLIKFFLLRIIYLLDVYNKIQVGVELFTLGQFEKFKMATNVTENQPIFFKNKTSNTNKMLFTKFSNMRSTMLLLVLCKDSLFT